MAETQKNDKARDFEVTLTDVRLSFAHLFKAQVPKPDKVTGLVGPAKFNCSFLIPKNTEAGKALKAKIAEVIKACGNAKWGENPPKGSGGKAKWSLKPEKLCLRDGDLENYDGYEGMFYLSASNTTRPKVLGRRKEVLTAEDGKPYSGCYVNAVVRIWAQANEHGNRINASLEGVQFIRDGERFGAAELSDDAFADLGDDGEADALSGDSSEEGLDEIL